MTCTTRIASIFGILLLASGATAAEWKQFEGYAEWRKGETLIVDGRRVLPAPQCNFKGKGQAHDFDSIPLGYEVKVEAEALPTGEWLAYKVEAKPNGVAMFESDIRHNFDALEDEFQHWGRVFDVDCHGRRIDYGRLIEGGPDVDDVRRFVERLLPPYVDPRSIRVYLVEHPSWRALASPNGAVYVNTGLLDADEDELAMLLAHELAHMTHEHARRQAKQGFWAGLLTAGGLAIADQIHSDAGRAAARALSIVGGIAVEKRYNQRCEDQAERVGKRYALEAGYGTDLSPRVSDSLGDDLHEDLAQAALFDARDTSPPQD